jgi:hypothetical protein
MILAKACKGAFHCGSMSAFDSQDVILLLVIGVVIMLILKFLRK